MDNINPSFLQEQLLGSVGWIKGIDYPEWMVTRSLETLKGGYLIGNETPKDAINRIANRVAELMPSSVYDGDLKQAVFNSIWNQEVSPSSPVWSNFGSSRGLPISCLTGDSWINTRSGGGTLIKNLKKGDEVLTHKGRWRKVTHIQNRMSTNDIYELRVKTRNTPIKITGNHPVLTNLGWVKVEELNPTIHFIATNNSLQPLGELHTLDFEKYNKKGSTCKFNTDVEVDSDLAWALGLWFAEGSISKNATGTPSSIRITMGMDERETLKRWNSIISKKFGINSNIYDTNVIRKNGKENSWLTACANSTVVASYFEKEYGVDCKTKTISTGLKEMKVDLLKKFFEGFYKGDGRKTHESQNFTISNPRLAMSLYEVGLKCGYEMGLRMKDKPAKLSTTPHLYTVNVYCNQGEKIGLRRATSQSGIAFNDGNRYCSFKLIKLDHNETVYDITVEEDHSFSVCGVVVHNCFNSHVDDSISGIYGTLAENAKMSQMGGGTSSYWGDVRPRGSGISDQKGTTGGPFEFLSNYDGMIAKVSQGGTRRGSHAAYIDFDHADVEELLEIKRVGCDIQNLFTGICISKEDREDIYDEDPRALRVWSKILESRNKTGMPYLLFKDNVNDGKTTPPWYGLNKTQIKGSNLCSEIMLPSNKDESFVCCLLSMNAITFDSWKDNDSVIIANIILEAILEDFIIKTTGITEMQRARRFALRHRAVGLGLLGYHSYLQSKHQPFVGLYSEAITRKILQVMKTKSRESSKSLSKILGNAPIVEEYNNKFNTNHAARHSTLLAIAPTVSNATIGGGLSPGIEPYSSNYFSQKGAKGNFTVVNQFLLQLIEEKYPMHNTKTTLDSIRDNSGSVQHLVWMEEFDREIFKTFSEINQFELVRLAAIRQEYVDQGQSLNVHIAPDTDPAIISALYLMGAELGIKSFYYQRSTNILRDKNGAKLDAMDASACVACEG